MVTVERCRCCILSISLFAASLRCSQSARHLIIWQASEDVVVRQQAACACFNIADLPFQRVLHTRRTTAAYAVCEALSEYFGHRHFKKTPVMAAHSCERHIHAVGVSHIAHQYMHPSLEEHVARVWIRWGGKAALAYEMS